MLYQNKKFTLKRLVLLLKHISILEFYNVIALLFFFNCPFHEDVFKF